MFRRKLKSDVQLQEDLEKTLGPGPMRFGPVTYQVFSSFRSLSERLKLSAEDIAALTLIQSKWAAISKNESNRKKLTRAQILRIAHFHKFDVDRSLKLMTKIKARRLDLHATTLTDQLASQTLFPCPGLESLDGSKVFIMRPSRYCPIHTSVADVIDNLIFVMDHMAQQDLLGQGRGIAFVANMDGWTMKNFAVDYCRKFMMALQGNVFPAKVNLFVILNPPSWFEKVRFHASASACFCESSWTDAMFPFHIDVP